MFDHPELVAELVPYLSPKDMARCVATCKTFASIFEPYLYRQVDLAYRNPTMYALPRCFHHVRILRIHDYYLDSCLEDLVGAMNASESTAPTAAVTSTGMTNLQRLTISIGSGANGYSQVALNTIISILVNNSRLTHLELQMYGNLLESSVGPRLLDLLRSGLPRLQRLVLKGYHALPMIQALEALEICLGHPNLIEVQFYTQERCHFSRVQFQENNACQLTSLVLPYIIEGYPRSFLLPLLRTHLPHLERFEVPVLDGPYESELEEVVAGHCRNLQHVSYTFRNWMGLNSSVIEAVIRGCSRWNGLKSIRITSCGARFHIDSSRRLVETLVEHHSKTLESVELQGWDSEGVSHHVLDPIFTGCRNLKSFKVLPENKGSATLMFFAHTPTDPWVFQGIKELHLYFFQKHLYQDDIEAAEQELEAGERMFEQIGKLIHLETLVLDFSDYRYHAPSEWDLDDSIEDEWLKELAGLDKLRYLCMPSRCWGEEQLSPFIDSSWPRLEKVCSWDPNGRIFKWLKAQRPWLEFVSNGRTS
ncbi:MAG: hypothetical protein J3Q66DRAFT_137304 [Benniella sp.]|nr:MAG: hypothetical protein J3Q66DRAFT_137304 [Benniella sp.]